MTESIADEDVAHNPAPSTSAPESPRGTRPGERTARSDAAERRRRRPSDEHPWWGPMPADRHE
ncbi:MAG: hypothetical protein K0Q52_3687 [Microbacterium sp.]|jgi:hypothetical protein|nr:hypothetical protein [Microbacterium sp.]